MIGCFDCPITANCLITLSNYNCTEWLVKNEAANALIIFEEFVMVMINIELITLALMFVLCSCTRHFVLTVPLSNQEYKWVPVYFQGSLMKCRGLILWWAVIPFRGGTYIVILLVTSCYRNRDNLRWDGPHLSLTSL